MSAIRRIEPEGHGDIWPNGHYNPSRTVTVYGVEYMLNAGDRDTVSLYSTPWGVAVVTRNYGMQYVGVGLLDPEGEVIRDGSLFAFADHTAVRETDVHFFQHTEPGQIGPRDTFDYTDTTILRRILEGRE